MSQSDGMLSTDVFDTEISGRSALMRLRNFVAPIAEDPIPASHAKMIFFTPSVFSILSEIPALAAALSPFASAFIDAISLCAFSRLFPPASFTIGPATTNEIPVEIKTPATTLIRSLPGVIIRYAIIEPGDAGPTRPQPVILNQKMPATLPKMGAIMTSGFIRIYGK